MAAKEATEKMFFNADKTKFVPEGSADAASLAAAVGDPIPELAVAEGKAKKAADVEDKQADPPANKSGVIVKKAK